MKREDVIEILSDFMVDEDLINIAADRIMELNQWVPTSERMPERSDADEKGKVLVFRKLNESQAFQEKSILPYEFLKHCEKDSTYWQPLPPAPGKEESK